MTKATGSSGMNISCIRCILLFARLTLDRLGAFDFVKPPKVSSGRPLPAQLCGPIPRARS